MRPQVATTLFGAFLYGEDVESGLRFLFNAMAPKDESGQALQGIPEALYLDNGPGEGQGGAAISHRERGP